MKFTPLAGDEVFDKSRNQSYLLERVEGDFMYSKTLGWMNWNGEIHPHVSMIRRQGTQVYPEVPRG